MMLAHPFWSKYREPPPPLRPADLFRDIHWDPITIVQLTLRELKNGQANAEDIFQAVVKFRHPNGTRIFNEPEVFLNTLKAMSNELGLLSSEINPTVNNSMGKSSSSISPSSPPSSPSSSSRERQKQKESAAISLIFSLTEKAKQEVYEPAPYFEPMAHHRIQKLPPEPFALPSPKRLPPLPGTSEFQFIQQEWEHWHRIMNCWAGPQAEKRFYDPPFHIESGFPRAPIRKSWEWYANHHNLGPKPFFAKYGPSYVGRKNPLY